MKKATDTEYLRCTAASTGGMTHPVKAAAHGLVEGVGQIGGAQNEDARLVAVDALHLHQELRLDAPRGLALAVPSAAAERIDLHGMTTGEPQLKRRVSNLSKTDAFQRCRPESKLQAYLDETRYPQHSPKSIDASVREPLDVADSACKLGLCGSPRQ